MANGYEIGLPPKHSSFTGGTNGMESKKAYLKIKFTPKKSNTSNLVELSNLMTGKITLVDGSLELKKRVTALLGNIGSVGIDGPIYLHVLSETPFTETFSNSLQNITLFGQLSESLANSSISKAGQGFQAAGVNLNPMTNHLKKITNGQINEGVDVLNKTGEIMQDKNMIAAMLENQLGDPELAKQLGLMDVAGNLAGHAVNVLSGNKPIFPNLWFDSTYSCNYAYSIRLYNPNPANRELHIERIIKPLATLLAMVLPYTEVVSETYTAPLYLDAECPGLFRLPACMINSLTVVRGGDDNAIAFNNRPSIVDLRFTLGQVYDKRLLGPSNASDDMYINPDIAILAEESEYQSGRRVNIGGTPSGQTSNSAPQSLQANDRVDPNLLALDLDLRARGV